MPPVPPYIEIRIRRTVPINSFIVPGSTPVVAFGNAQTATVATLGLNPSRIEFLDRDGRELTGTARRLATHRSLGSSDLSDLVNEAYGLTAEEVALMWETAPPRMPFAGP